MHLNDFKVLTLSHALACTYSYEQLRTLDIDSDVT